MVTEVMWCYQALFLQGFLAAHDLSKDISDILTNSTELWFTASSTNTSQKFSKKLPEKVICWKGSQLNIQIWWKSLIFYYIIHKPKNHLVIKNIDVKQLCQKNGLEMQRNRMTAKTERLSADAVYEQCFSPWGELFRVVNKWCCTAFCFRLFSFLLLLNHKI